MAYIVVGVMLLVLLLLGLTLWTWYRYVMFVRKRKAGHELPTPPK